MRKVRKAVFPVAGLGTRFLPATKAIPKEMLTVVDRPVIQYVVDEAREAGIEHLIFVTGRNKGVIEDYFDIQVELVNTLTDRNKQTELKLLDSLQPTPGTASFTRQQAPLGLGHAVWCARDLVGPEPFALLLPRHDHAGHAGLPEEDGRALRGDRRQRHLGGAVRPAETHKYGIVGKGPRSARASASTAWSKSRRPTRRPRTSSSRPLHPAARDLRHPVDAGEGRGQRDPADRRHAEARQAAGFLSPTRSPAAPSTAARRRASSRPTSPSPCGATTSATRSSTTSRS